MQLYYISVLAEKLCLVTEFKVITNVSNLNEIITIQDNFN